MKKPHWPNFVGNRDIKFGLDRVYKLLSRLDMPHLQLPPVVHVAGTNGKGSTIAFLRAILEEAGYSCHVYTSPHLIEFNERISLAGEQISDEYLTDILERCRVASEAEGKYAGQDKIPVTFFEGTTVAAFLAFAEVQANIVLLETGMGGRLDATNVIPEPLCTIITPISEDHQKFLGDDIAQIAGEKAGIIKQGVPVVISKQFDEAMAAIKDKALEKSAACYAYGKNWKVEDSSYVSNKHKIKLDNLSLLGEHQKINAACAVAAIDALAGYNIPEHAIINGLKNAKWQARLQKLEQGKLFDLAEGRDIWLDGGHNKAATEALADFIESNEIKPILILAMSEGHDPEEFLKPLKSKIEEVIAVEIENEPLLQPTENIKQVANRLGIKIAEMDSVEKSIKYTTKNYDSGIIITGSLYLAGRVLAENN